MTNLNFIAGGSADRVSSYTDNWVQTTSGVALPTNATLAANGKRPVYVNTARCYWAGRGGSRSIKLIIGGKSSATKTVAADSEAFSSGNISIGYLSANGGTVSVKIDSNGSFYFGRNSDTGTTVDSSGYSWEGGLAGAVDYFTVPTAPSSVSVVQASLENAVNVSWSAPSSNGGSAITSYTLQWAYNSSFTGATTIVTGSTATSHKITGLTYGSTVYVKVAAVNVVATAASTTSVFSSSANGYLIPPDLPLDGWANFGTLTNNTFTIEHTAITSLLPETGIIRKATASATGGSYSTGNFGVEKTYTGLTVGRQYVVSGKAILMTASTPGNIYRFAVTGIGNGSSVTLTSTTVGATIPSYTFTATSTTHVVQIELAETFTVSATGTQEHVAFYDYALTRTATDLSYRLQDNMITDSLVKHFDIATQSVGAAWWIDKNNVTQFAQDFDQVEPSCTFADVVGDGNVYFNDIGVSFDTSALVNQIVFKNAGVRRALRGNSDVEAYEVEWIESDNTSIDNWGARQFALETNLQTAVVAQNLFPYPSFENMQHEGDSTNFFYSVEKPANDNTGAWAAYDGDNAFRAYAKTSAGTAVALSYDARIDVTAGTTYYGFGYAATTATPNTRARYRVVWYDETNAILSTVYGSYVSLSSYKTWYKVSWSAAAPTNAVYARIGVSYDRSTGAAFAATSKQWADGMYFGTSNQTTYFDGDTTDDANYLYAWNAGNDASSSTKYTNILDTRTGELLTQFSTPQITISSLRWNTAQNPVLAATLDVGSIVTITFRETTNNYRVVGITHEATPDNWHMTLQVAKEN